MPHKKSTQHDIGLKTGPLRKKQLRGLLKTKSHTVLRGGGGGGGGGARDTNKPKTPPKITCNSVLLEAKETAQKGQRNLLGFQFPRLIGVGNLLSLNLFAF